MPRFRFVAADSTGHVSDGTIDAPTPAGARNKLAANGLAVRELEEVASAPGADPPPLPRRATTAPRPTGDSSPPIPTTRPRRAETPEAARRGSPVTLLLSIIALVLSLSSMAYVFYRDPPWGRLSRYDFSTPEAAYTSQIRLSVNGDFQAQQELFQRLQGKLIREKLETLRIDRRADFQGKVILFIEYYMNGSRMREFACFERDPDQSKFWKQDYSIGPNQVRPLNPKLASEMETWASLNHGGFFPGIVDDMNQ